jgi:ribosomal protein L7Ae-like RNA K-turn-binding protein
MTRTAETDRPADMFTGHQRIQRLLGLARKAGSTAVGLRAAEKSMQRGHCRLVLIARDASTRTSRIVRRDAGQIPMVMVESQRVLGGWLGLSPVAVVAITQKDLAKAIEEAARSPSAGNDS